MAGQSYRFGDIEVDPVRFQALRAGSAVPLEPKAFEVLLHLVSHPDRLVSREELLDAVWKDTFVTPNALTRVIANLRRALGDDAQEAKYIETVPRRGYRFIAEVTNGGGLQGEGRAQARPPREAESAEAEARPPQEPGSRAEARPPQEPDHRIWPLLAGGAAIVAAAAVFVWFAIGRSHFAPPAVRLSLATQVTSGAALDREPALSPDGRFIAWSSNDSGTYEIYVKPLATDGRTLAATNDAQNNIAPAWSPDGQYLAYQSRGRRGIWVVPVTGGAPRRLTDAGANPSWSPDGARVAFDSYTSALVSQSSIWTVNADGSGLATLTRAGDPPGSHQRPIWSPDGRLVAFATTGARMWTLEVLDTVTGHVATIGQGFGTAGIAFAPRGDALYWIGRLPMGNSLIWRRAIDPRSGAPLGPPQEVMRSDANQLAGLSVAGDRIAWSSVSTTTNLYSLPVRDGVPAADPSPVTNTTDRNSYPVFSPDGRSLAFVVMRPGAVADVWTASADGSDAAVLLADDAVQFHPSWAPGGDRVLAMAKAGDEQWLVSLDPVSRRREMLRRLGDEQNVRLSPDGATLAYHAAVDGVINVFTMPLAGGPPAQVTFDAEAAAYPAWSPDGTRLAVEVKRGEDVHVGVVPASGGQVRVLTSGQGMHWPHSWSPDGSRIAFAGESDGVWNVYAVHADTGEVSQLTRISAVNGYVRYPAWSPAGDRIVYEQSSSRGNLWLARIE